MLCILKWAIDVEDLRICSHSSFTRTPFFTVPRKEAAKQLRLIFACELYSSVKHLSSLTMSKSMGLKNSTKSRCLHYRNSISVKRTQFCYSFTVVGSLLKKKKKKKKSFHSIFSHRLQPTLKLFFYAAENLQKKKKMLAFKLKVTL